AVRRAESGRKYCWDCRRASAPPIEPFFDGRGANRGQGWKTPSFTTLGPLLPAMIVGLGGAAKESFSMCDYSLHHVQSRAAHVGDKLTTRNFGTGTRGFAAPENPTTAVCVLPGTELAFAGEIAFTLPGGSRSEVHKTNFKTAIFRQVNKH